MSKKLLTDTHLPTSDETLATRLVIVRHAWGETWSRTFAGRALVTIQYQHGAELLAERLGWLEFWFRLRVIEHALDFWHVGTAGVFGPMRVPLPRWLSPRITARAWAGLEEGSLQVAVRVSLPFIGQGFQHVWRLCHAQSLCGLTTKLPPSTVYENDGHVSTFWQLVQQ